VSCPDRQRFRVHATIVIASAGAPIQNSVANNAVEITRRRIVRTSSGTSRCMVGLQPVSVLACKGTAGV
jgi:hypothetical protein